MITENIRIQDISGVIRVFNAREPGTTIRYGSVLRHHELIYKWSGDSISTLGNRSYSLAQGSVLYLPKGPCGSYSVQTLRQGEAIDILFEANVPLFIEPTLLPGPHKSLVSHLFEQCHEVWTSASPGRKLHCFSEVYGILSTLMDESREAILSASSRDQLRKAVDYLEAHLFEEKTDLEEAARQAGISYSYLKRLFLRQYGVSPTHYLTQRRMEYARGWLQSSEMSITDLSARLGYSSVYYFSRVFHRENGISPSEYKKRMH